MTNPHSRVDINHAARDVLAELPGIGASLAGRIVAYREAVAPFQTLDDLLNVPGISDRKLAALADHITVTPLTPEEPAPLVRWDDLGLPEIPAAAPPADESAAAQVTPLAETPAEDADESAADDSQEEAVVAAADGEAWPLPQDLVEAITLPEDPPPPAPEPFAPLPEPDRQPPSFMTDGAAEARRMGCLPVLGGLIGAVLAIIVTLGVLAFFNGGTLRFASAARINALQSDQSNLEVQLGELQSALATAQADGRSSRAALSTLAADAADTAATAEALATAVGDIDMAAEDFNGLIAGLRDLLNGLPGSGATATPAPESATATPTASAADNTPTPQPDEGPTPAATRTPRPTATPFQTAVPQPTATP